MQRLALTLTAAFILAMLCYMMWSMVQPVQESERLAISWHTGTGKTGQVSGTLRDAKGTAIPDQDLTLHTSSGATQTRTDAAGQFAAEIPSAGIIALEIPGIDPFKFSPAIPNAQEGVSLEVIVK
jgi:hypothetical protein